MRERNRETVEARLLGGRVVGWSIFREFTVVHAGNAEFAW